MSQSTEDQLHSSGCFLVCFLFTFALTFVFLSVFITSNSSAVFLSPISRHHLHSTVSANSTTKSATSTNNTQKVVLFWTNFFGDPWRSHFSDFGGNILPAGDGSGTCLFTTDRNRSKEADAVVFHGRDFNFNDLPRGKPNFQRWVFYLLESPVHSGFGHEDWARAGRVGFDWTMTYSRKAHVFAPYCQLVPRITSDLTPVIENRSKLFAQSFSKRPRDVVWFVSNCSPPSQRQKLADGLRANGIGVDSFGHCSNDYIDEEIESIGKEAFFSQYRFYAAFENSLCSDYLSEKFGNAMNASLLYGLIPLVYSGADYSAFVSNDSAIDAEYFPSLRALADYLTWLKQPEQADAVAGYFKWHNLYEKADCNFPRLGFTNLCQKLFNDDEPDGHHRHHHQPTLKNLESLMGDCRFPKFF